ncbi:UbiA-like polyprenyltransferase [Paraliomyxa miuraensis]|uniref:UbiA-like polyprenyltransferase n=1 Tax=Paraliomyxa miuraensis TaxID=376150 RepID=UPI002251F1B9|nr:UbiA-like polyprenyltransferase [Paraliomyxa miuraensis]MCX4244734.1 putative 4-hydroxybenzoate polyprenyltransferase [Paraliomyxa miuraensis]
MSAEANALAPPPPGSSPPAPSPGVWHDARAFSRLVKLGHTVFGLPFALAAAMLADRYAVAHGGEGLTWGRLCLLVLAFAGARAAAMGWNRIADRRFDAANPRTADREIPAGVISVRAAALFTVLCAAVFVGAAVALGPVPAVLSVPCLVIVLAYSLFKRFSWASHLFLGLALALAPGGAFVAITGGLSGWWIPVPLMLAVATWVAGFDVLYSLADESFDRAHGLHSIPVRFGVRGALVISALLHVGTMAALGALHVVAGPVTGLSWVHLCGLLLIATILVHEHWIVRPGDLRRLDKAFFDLNGYVALAYLAAVAVDVLVL